MKNRLSFRRVLLLPVFRVVVPLLCVAVATAQAQTPGGQDASFATGPSSSGSVHALALQPNGQVLVGGGFSVLRGAARSSVARLNPDGSLDSFNPGLAITGYERRHRDGLRPGVCKPTVRIIAAGGFTVLGQTAGGGVARLQCGRQSG